MAGEGLRRARNYLQFARVSLIVLRIKSCGEFLLQRRFGERACDMCKESVRAKRYYEKKSKQLFAVAKRSRLQAKMKAGLKPFVC
jgi:hypothetical protein